MATKTKAELEKRIAELIKVANKETDRADTATNMVRTLVELIGPKDWMQIDLHIRVKALGIIENARHTEIYRCDAFGFERWSYRDVRGGRTFKSRAEAEDDALNEGFKV